MYEPVTGCHRTYLVKLPKLSHAYDTDYCRAKYEVVLGFRVTLLQYLGCTHGKWEAEMKKKKIVMVGWDLGSHGMSHGIHVMICAWYSNTAVLSISLKINTGLMGFPTRMGGSHGIVWISREIPWEPTGSPSNVHHSGHGQWPGDA